MNVGDRPFEHEAVHSYFGLTYANYLVLPRAVLQSMPDEWQERFVTCLQELQETPFDWKPPPSYLVTAREESGRFIKNNDPHYNRGRTVVPLRSSDRDEVPD